MVSEATETNQRAILVKFVYNNKLSARVRTAIGASPTSIEDLTTKLKARYKLKKSLAAIELALQKCQQHNKTVDKYADAITDLITELNQVQIEQTPDISTEAVHMLNNAKALRVFLNGLNEPIRTTTTAARPKTMEEALGIAREVEMQPTTANIMQFRGPQQANRNSNQKGRSQNQQNNNRQPKNQHRRNNNQNINRQPNNQNNRNQQPNNATQNRNWQSNSERNQNRNGQSNNSNRNWQQNNQNNNRNQNWQQQSNNNYRPQHNQRGRNQQSQGQVRCVQELPEAYQENLAAPEEDQQ